MCLTDGDALLRLFGDYGIHLHMEEDEEKRGLNLEDYDAVASLEATMTFLEVGRRNGGGAHGQGVDVHRLRRLG